MFRKPAFRLFVLLLFLLLAAFLTSCVPVPVCGVSEYLVTKVVDTNDGECTAADCSLREAIDNANACTGLQTIRLPAGIYTLSISGKGEDAAAQGDLDITDDLIIIGESMPIINANGIDRVFDIFSPAHVELEALTIRGGVEQYGGGIRNASHLIVKNSLVVDNTASVPAGGSGTSYGGGIFNEDLLILWDTRVQSNIAGVGGGIMLDGAGILEMAGTNASIDENFAFERGGGLAMAAGTTADLLNTRIWLNEANDDGGGIFNSGSLTVNLGHITDNSALVGTGGGIFNEGNAFLADTVVATNINTGITNQGDSLELVNSTVGNNTGEAGISSFKPSPPLVPVILTNTVVINNDGYGFYGINAELTITGGSISGNLNSGVFNHSYLSMSGTTVSGNSSPFDGGGLYLVNILSATIDNSTISENQAVGDGGGVYFWGLGMGPGTLSLTNVTVSGNVAGGNGGGVIVASNPPSVLNLSSVTLSLNQAVGLGSGNAIYNNGTTNLLNSILDGPMSGENCAGNTAGILSLGHNLSSDNTCLYGGTNDLLSIDPLLDPLQDNGGGTQTHALSPSSPAIDSADTGSCPATDQRGVSRPQGSDCDRGAFELEEGSAPTPTPSPTEPPPPISINFNADRYRIVNGECTVLRWQVDNATDVFLEGQRVEMIGAQQVCPSQTTTYVMQVPSSEGDLEAKVTIEIETPPLPPTNLQITNWTCNKIYNLTLTWTDQANNETGYRVYRDGTLIAKLPAGSTSYQDTPPAGGLHTYGVEAANEAGASTRVYVTESKECPPFQ